LQTQSPARFIAVAEHETLELGKRDVLISQVRLTTDLRPPY